MELPIYVISVWLKSDISCFQSFQILGLIEECHSVPEGIHNHVAIWTKTRFFGRVAYVIRHRDWGKVLLLRMASYEPFLRHAMR
jgi:hypothetical protein